MPTLLVVRNLMFVIYTRDHGYPHVTVYFGRPRDWEARAKVRLDHLSILDSDGFDRAALKEIVEITAMYQAVWLEVWNEIQEEQN